ncbi:MAG: translation elongation factor Ts, partial [Erysipelotrichaceae bacterium]
IHMGGTISALTILKGSTDAAVAKDMAMQIASMSPVYVDMKDVPTAEMDREKAVQNEIMAQDPAMSKKPQNVLDGIIVGRLSKHFKDQCLLEQEFFKDSKLKISQVLKQANASIDTFIRFQVGEGIEKKEENFAEEVMSQIKK